MLFVHASGLFAFAPPACNHANKQKALYLTHTLEPSLADSPATDLSIDVHWLNTSSLREYGSNGVFAAQPFGTVDGPGGYFGSQSDGDPAKGGLLFSIWDAKRKAPHHCAHEPNATWCQHQHAFPLGGSCQRHCLDCGLHPGWHNTTGVQCSIPLTISEGDSFRFRLWRVSASAQYDDPTSAETYKGSEWRLTATRLHGSLASSAPIEVGHVFLEDTVGGVDRLESFHEHIGCVPCAAFFESEARVGPTIAAPHKRRAVSVALSRKPDGSCDEYAVRPYSDGSGVPGAQFLTGPGAVPPTRTPMQPTTPSLRDARLLYGLALVANGPAKFGLAVLDPTSGAAVVVGGAHDELFGEGDLVALDSARGLLYYLGDSRRGATLVALNTSDGAEVCSAAVALRETLSFDATSDTLVLSGLVANGTASHAVFRAPAKGDCGPFTRVGSYGDAEFVPMLHSSSLDAKGQRLFVTLATSKTSAAIGVVDLSSSPKGVMHVIAEGPGGANDTLLSLHWDPKVQRLIGVVAGATLQLHSLDPSGDGSWAPPRALSRVPANWNSLGGNSATASAFDAPSRQLFLLAGQADAASGDVAFDLATIDVDSASVVMHPPLAPVGMPGCSSCLEALAV